MYVYADVQGGVPAGSEGNFGINVRSSPKESKKKREADFFSADALQ